MNNGHLNPSTIEGLEAAIVTAIIIASLNELQSGKTNDFSS